MIGKAPTPNQMDLFRPLLHEFINLRHELVILSGMIDWRYFERSFAKFYSRRGKPAMHIRFMVGSLMLKHIYDLSYRSLAQNWVVNPYMQYFCGEVYFKHKFPCDPTDFAHFKNRIGQEGLDLIFTHLSDVKGHHKELAAMNFVNATC